MTRLRKCLLIAAALAAVAILVPVLRHYQLKAAVARYRAGLVAKGEPMELARVAPAPIPPERNSAGLLTNACALLSTNLGVLSDNPPSAMRMVAPGKAMAGWAQPDVRSFLQGPHTNSWTEVDAALAEEQAALTMLRQLPAGAQFDFGYDYSGGWGHMKLAASLAPAKQAAYTLTASAVAALRRQDTDTAVKDVAAIQSLTSGFSHDRVLLSELVRIAIAQIAMTANWELLQSTSVTDEQLARLQSGWAGLDFTQAFENAMLVERFGGEIETRKLRASGLESYFQPLRKLGFSSQDEGAFELLETKAKATLWRYWWSYPDEVRHLQTLQAVLEAARQARTNGSFLSANTALKQWFKEHEVSLDEDEGFWWADPGKANFHYILSQGAQSSARALDKVLLVEAARQLTITVIALKRYQLQHGRLPDQLADLTPALLAAIPVDPVDGKPLRYLRNPDNTFLLYSIGEDGVNDGGDASPAAGQAFHWQKGRDWVWPQPATAAEIKAWEAQQGKSR